MALEGGVEPYHGTITPLQGILKSWFDKFFHDALFYCVFSLFKIQTIENKILFIYYCSVDDQ